MAKTLGEGLIEHGTRIHNNVNPDHTYPGMAHWAGSGPFATCQLCAHWGGKKEKDKKPKAGPCWKFKRLTGKVGAPVPPEAAACKYFETAK